MTHSAAMLPNSAARMTIERLTDAEQHDEPRKRQSHHQHGVVDGCRLARGRRELKEGGEGGLIDDINGASIPNAMVSAPGMARLTTKGINLPFDAVGVGLQARARNEGIALMSTSNMSMLLVVKKYALPVKIQTSASSHA